MASASTAFPEADSEDLLDVLGNIWKNPCDAEQAATESVSLINKQIEGLIRTGLDALHRLENCKRDLQQSNDDCAAKQQELDRLRASEKKSRQTIAVCDRFFACCTTFEKSHVALE